MRGIMVMGTASDVGKSMLCTAFCRLLADEGERVAPFKSQNMSRFAIQLENGHWMSQAQYIQAEAARTKPLVEMNPIFIEPIASGQSNIYLLGQKVDSLSGMDYRQTYYERALATIQQSLEILQKNYDVLILEGAGSPAEVNLNDRDVVNMRVADMADVPVILVADISKGGAMAAVVGTLQLLSSAHRARVKGIIMNQFHGDLAFFQDGIQWIESYTNLPVIGVIPYYPHHGIEEEDTPRQVATVPPSIDKYQVWAQHVKRHLNWSLIKDLIDSKEG